MMEELIIPIMNCWDIPLKNMGSMEPTFGDIVAEKTWMSWSEEPITMAIVPDIPIIQVKIFNTSEDQNRQQVM